MSWTNIGSFRVAKNGKRKFVINKDVQILYKGNQVDLGEFRTAACRDSLESVQGLLERGIITQEEAEKKMEYINEKQIKFDVVIPPADKN